MKKELLAPAGDFETLKQAIHHGADAIYLGGKKFGARKFASNFDEEEMVSAIKYCHLYGVKIYVTVNTMIYEEELEEVVEYVSFLHHAHVDAVIIQDLGLIKILREKFPNLELHASTQLHNHNQEQLKFLEELGIKRVVVARELSLDEINNLNTTMEIECFIHGALCVCYSGQCLFSSLLLGRSGNRGSCAGICRLPFELLEDGKKIESEGKYLLSPKELNTMDHIEELMKSNIASFKIEGRMKSPTTIGFIVSLYRKLIDGYEKKEPYQITEEDKKNLKMLFNREFTDGYLFHSTVYNLMNIKSPNHIGYPIGKVVSIKKDKIELELTEELNQEDGIRFLESETGMIVNFLYDKSMKLTNSIDKNCHAFIDNKAIVQVGDIVMKTLDHKLLKSLEQYSLKKIGVLLEANASVENGFTLTVIDGENKITKTAYIVQQARENPTTKERIIVQLNKTGSTPFIVENIKIEMPEDLFIPISSLNELRRSVLEELMTVRENKGIEVIENNQNNNREEYPVASKLNYTASIYTREQLEACIESGINEFYTTDFSLYQEYKDKIKIYYRLSRINQHHRNYQKERLLIGEYGSLLYAKENEVVSDYFLNIANHKAVDYLFSKNVSRVTISVENNLTQLKKLLDAYEVKPNLEMIIYGRIEAMVMKYCPLSLIVNKKETPCNCCRNGKKYQLKDRNNAIYPLRQENERTHIFYHTPVEIEVDDYIQIGIKAFRFEFIEESGEEIKSIIKKYRK